MMEAWKPRFLFLPWRRFIITDRILERRIVWPGFYMARYSRSRHTVIYRRRPIDGEEY